MIEYLESKIARREYEERVQSLLPVHDYDVELTHKADDRQAQPIGIILSSIAVSLTSLSAKLKPKSDVALESSHVGQERSSATGWSEG